MDCIKKVKRGQEAITIGYRFDRETYTLPGHKLRLLTAKFAEKTQRYAEEIFVNSAPTLGSLRLKEIPKKRK